MCKGWWCPKVTGSCPSPTIQKFIHEKLFLPKECTLAFFQSLSQDSLSSKAWWYCQKSLAKKTINLPCFLKMGTSKRLITDHSGPCDSTTIFIYSSLGPFPLDDFMFQWRIWDQSITDIYLEPQATQPRTGESISLDLRIQRSHR